MNTHIANNRQDFERKVAQIRANPDLNDEARRRMIGTGDHGPIKPAELDGYAVRAPSSDAASG
jgi:hypothetical protein